LSIQGPLFAILGDGIVAGWRPLAKDSAEESNRSVEFPSDDRSDDVFGAPDVGWISRLLQGVKLANCFDRLEGVVESMRLEFSSEMMDGCFANKAAAACRDRYR